MVGKNYSPTSCINEHVRKTYKNCKKETSDKYLMVLQNINAIIKDNGFETNPRYVDEDTIQFLLEYWGDYAISTKKWYLHILNRYLKIYNNSVIEEMEIYLGYDDRPNVEWLSDDESTILMETRLTPLEDLVIHLELCMGLRISEVVKLQLQDVHFSDDPSKCYISVLGKGRGEGKWRTIPFHPLSQEVFEAWIERRPNTFRESDLTILIGEIREHS